MNNIIERIDEFLSEREAKEKFMIYASIFIVFIIIYYFFNYSVLYRRLKEEKSSLTNTQKQYDIASYEKKLKLKRNEYLNLYTRIKRIKNDLKKIDNIIYESKYPKLIVKNDDIFKYLKGVFNYSISKYVFPSYKISKKSRELTKYTIRFRGETSFNNFRNFLYFLRYMENNNFISYFNRVEFNVSNYGGKRISDFNGSFNIWSYK